MDQPQDGRLAPLSLKLPTVARRQTARAFTLVEVMVGCSILAVLGLALTAAFSSGLATVHSARENLRATQIMMQKMETIRLLTWTQGTNTIIAPTTFTDYYDPTGTNTQAAGTIYQGTFSVAPAPASLPGAYRGDMRLATVTVYWTNNLGSKGILLRSKQMQTYVARYGMQDYVYGQP
jgi:uncharacterized protein (TIGR02598 family)